jgi:hypothetical protein
MKDGIIELRQNGASLWLIRELLAIAGLAVGTDTITRFSPWWDGEAEPQPISKRPARARHIRDGAAHVRTAAIPVSTVATAVVSTSSQPRSSNPRKIPDTGRLQQLLLPVGKDAKYKPAVLSVPDCVNHLSAPVGIVINPIGHRDGDAELKMVTSIFHSPKRSFQVWADLQMPAAVLFGLISQTNKQFAGSACIRLDNVGQALMVHAGQKLTFDPVANRLEDPVDVDLSQVLTTPLVKDFRRLPSAPLIEQEVQKQHGNPGRVTSNPDLMQAIRMAGASSLGTAAPDQFMRALNSLFARSNAGQTRDYVSAAIQARPDLADRIVVAALGKQLSGAEIESIIRAAIEAHPAATREIVRAAIAAVPMMRDSIVAAANVSQPCQDANAFVEPVILNSINPANTIPEEVVSPEQPPGSGF